MRFSCNTALIRFIVPTIEMPHKISIDPIIISFFEMHFIALFLARRNALT